MSRRLLLVLFILLLASPVLAEHFTNSPSVPPPQYATEDVFALVAVPRLNVRTAPSIETGVVLTIAKMGERYPVIKSDRDETWWLISIDGSRAWVSYEGVIIVQGDEIPDIDDPVDPSAEYLFRLNQEIGYVTNTVGVRTNVNIRRGPGTRYPVVGVIIYPGRAFVLGRNSYGTWLQVNYNGVVGWVYSLLAAMPPDFNLLDVPILQ